MHPAAIRTPLSDDEWLPLQVASRMNEYGVHCRQELNETSRSVGVT